MLDLTHPASPLVAARSALLLSQCDPRVQDRGRRFLAQALRAGHVLAVVQGRRTDAEQLALFRKGRALLRGVWHVTDPRLVVTRAQTARDSAHGCKCDVGDAHRKNDGKGCAMAFDFAFVLDGVLVGPRPGKGNDSWDADLPWAAVARIAEDCGLLSGARFGESRPGALDGWDAGHVELPGWRTLTARRDP